jgi:hypothetical protein
MITRRERLMDELLRLRRDGDSKLIETALQLLTRSWAAASWHAREGLLKTAEWLIRLEKRHGGNAEPAA